MSEGIYVDVSASTHLVRLNSATVDKVIHVLFRALEVRHCVLHCHQGGKFRTFHRSPPSPVGMEARSCEDTSAGIHAETPR